MTEAGAPPHNPPSPETPAPRPLPPLRWGRAALTGILAATALVLAVVVVAAVTDNPPDERFGAPETVAPPPPGTGPVHVERLIHQPGDCLTWDQSTGIVPVARALTTVPCTDPHLVEVTGQVIAPDLDHDPTEAELDELTDRLCQPVNEAHLGAPLDPDGRYYPAGIQPSPEGWRRGDREVWCALGAYDGTEDPFVPGDGRHRPLQGPVSAAGQHWRYERGDCLDGVRRAPVDCATDHEFEVVGHHDLPGETTLPPLDDRAGWAALVGEPCRAQARDWLGREPGGSLVVDWLGIGPGSWAAGMRTVHCVIGEVDGAGGWLVTRGSARDVPT